MHQPGYTPKKTPPVSRRRSVSVDHRATAVSTYFFFLAGAFFLSAFFAAFFAVAFFIELILPNVKFAITIDRSVIHI